MAVMKRKIAGIEEWRKILEAAGQYLIDNKDEILKEGERYCCAVNIQIKGIHPDELPVLAITKEYSLVDVWRKGMYDEK